VSTPQDFFFVWNREEGAGGGRPRPSPTLFLHIQARRRPNRRSTTCSVSPLYPVNRLVTVSHVTHFQNPGLPTYFLNFDDNGLTQNFQRSIVHREFGQAQEGGGVDDGAGHVAPPDAQVAPFPGRRPMRPIGEAKGSVTVQAAAAPLTPAAAPTGRRPRSVAGPHHFYFLIPFYIFHCLRVFRFTGPKAILSHATSQQKWSKTCE